MNLNRVAVLLILLQMSVVVWAKDEADGFQGKFQLGGALNYGNTENRNISTKLTLKHVNIDWDNNLNLSYYFSQEDKETTASRFKFDLNNKYKLTTHSYLFASFEGIFNKFGTYDRVYREAIGYGRKLYKNSVIDWSVYAGPGASHSRINGTKDYQNQIVGKIGSELCYQITEVVLFSQDIVSYIGHDNTNIQFNNALEAQISKRLALDISVLFDYNTNIPKKSTNRKSLDIITKFSIIYTFA
ncbi:MAG: DUF481 domain-containing protein [Legionellales bacterium]|nr:DUF481 domain-containing protein [Legionellales bacterium]